MIKYLSGWTYISKRGVRVTLISVDGDRVRHCTNNHRSAFNIIETSLANFKRWTDERRTLRLHCTVAEHLRTRQFVRKENLGYATELIANHV